ncbi:MAG: hypothetical protein FWD47_07850 [Treponema sp.]|nr:hypothetical protein [Treponema sp.]
MKKQEKLNLLQKENQDLILKTLDQDQKYEELKEQNEKQKKALGDDYLFEKLFNPRFLGSMELLCPDCRKKIEEHIVF